jgi:transcriptional regulator with XRE-family HTH domain
MVRPDATSSYAASEDQYNWLVHAFTIGDVIRKARIARRWSQTKLGQEATYFQFGSSTKPINKSTVSKVEREPYTSELGTVWRLLAALRLSFAEVDKRVGVPFTERKGSTRHARDQGRRPDVDRSVAAEKRGHKSSGRL